MTTGYRGEAPVVTSLGHAGLRIQTEHLSLLCDPWLSPRGAFLGSWFQFPDNTHLAVPAVLDCDWVAVSHEHLDHLDLDLLARLPDRVRVVIPHYPSNALRRRLAAAGVRNVVEVRAWERLQLNVHGDWLTVIPEQSPMCHDAAILVVVNDYAIMHTNDARLSVAQGRRATEEVGHPLDLMGVQMSGASWHPISYEYPPEISARIAADKRRSKFRAVVRLLRGVKPRIAMPYAGPPCFLDEPLRHHNRQMREPGVFPHQNQALAWLREYLPAQESLSMLPGDSINLGSHALERARTWADFDLDQPEEYLDRYAQRRAGVLAALYAEFPDPDPASALYERFEDHFMQLGSMSNYFLERIGMTIRFDVSGEAGGTWDVRLGPERVAVSRAGTNTPAYGFRVAARWLDPVLTGRIRWEDLLLSLRFSAWRDPDVYNDYLVGLLKHADPSALQAVEEYETGRDPNDTVALRDGDREVAVSRYCPHAGEDLAESSVISNGVLRCLAHNFEFDLASGACINARCDPLVVHPLVPQSG